MLNIRKCFNKALEDISKLPIQVLTQGDAVQVGTLTHKLMSAVTEPEKFKDLLINKGYGEVADIGCVFSQACEHNGVDIVRLMLDRYESLNTSDYLDANLSATVARAGHHLNIRTEEIIKALIAHGANPNVTNCDLASL